MSRYDASRPCIPQRRVTLPLPRSKTGPAPPKGNPIPTQQAAPVPFCPNHRESLIYVLPPWIHLLRKSHRDDITRPVTFPVPGAFRGLGLQGSRTLQLCRVVFPSRRRVSQVQSYCILFMYSPVRGPLGCCSSPPVKAGRRSEPRRLPRITRLWEADRGADPCLLIPTQARL